MAPPVGMPSSSGGAPTIPHEALVQQKQGMAIMIWTIGAFCIFGWEWIVCLPKEYRRIWRRPKNTSSILYIANRYFGLLQLIFVVTLNANAWSPAACKHVFYFEPVGALISTVLSQIILGSRVYAIFAQNKPIGALLLATLLVEIVVGGISVSTTNPPAISIIPDAPPMGAGAGARPPCSAVTGPFGWLVAFWSIPLFYDTLTFLLTAHKAYALYKSEVTTPLFDIIWRDGLLYFFGVFSMNLANVVIFLTVPRGLRAVNLSATLVLEVVLSCRLILNLRGAHGLSIPPSQASHQSQSHSQSHSHSHLLPLPLPHSRELTSKTSHVPMIRVHTTTTSSIDLERDSQDDVVKDDVVPIGADGAASRTLLEPGRNVSLGLGVNGGSSYAGLEVKRG